MEHAFILQSIIEYKKRKNNLYITWIDIKKAFDTIPHQILFNSIKKYNVPQTVINFIKNYTNILMIK